MVTFYFLETMRNKRRLLNNDFEGSLKELLKIWVGHQTDLANLLFYALGHITVQGNVMIDITAVIFRGFFQIITNPMH